MESRPLGDMRASDVLVLNLHEIVAGKLVALIDRHAARDLFDARPSSSRTRRSSIASVIRPSRLRRHRK
ncbi:MAG: hypothetical protein HC869_07835 [Rhodospirillales bacterium]|nr:hypothetical protein [Rhodospirillales bacterium]